MKSALVVIDVQNVFAVEKAQDLPDKIADHIKKSSYNYVLFTLFRNDPKSNHHKILHWYKATGLPDIGLHPALKEFSNGQNTFEKVTYSAFKSPAFVNFLEKHKVRQVDICGINIDGCVLATAYEAFDLGFKVRILEELSSVSSHRQDYVDSASIIIARNLKRKQPK